MRAGDTLGSVAVEEAHLIRVGGRTRVRVKARVKVRVRVRARARAGVRLRVRARVGRVAVEEAHPRSDEAHRAAAVRTQQLEHLVRDGVIG